MNKKFITCLLVCFLALAFNSNDAQAVARGAVCSLTGGGTSATATDGSNCDQGLTCDPRVLICSGTADIACSGNSMCSVGMTCYSINNSIIKSGTAGSGFCVTADGNAETNAFGQAMCNMFKFITGKVGRGVAAGAVIALGVFFFMGKVTWGSALAVALGVGAVFGAPSVVSVLTGKSFDC